jgi:hypothetical protein
MRYLVPAFVLIFGLMTLKEGGAVLFIEGSERQAAGQFVDWVLWFNFVTGFALLALGFGLFKKKSWVRPLAKTVMLLSLLVLTVFLIFIALGGAYELRTLIAMPFRVMIWFGLWYWTSRQKP